MKVLASVYRRRNKIFLHALAQTERGVYIAWPPFLSLDAAESATTLGNALLQVLPSAAAGVPHPTEWASVAKPLYDLAGVKSWSQFHKNAVMCDVFSDAENLILEPTENAGRGGFKELPGSRIVLPAATTAHEIGKALLAALDLSR